MLKRKYVVQGAILLRLDLIQFSNKVKQLFCLVNQMKTSFTEYITPNIYKSTWVSCIK